MSIKEQIREDLWDAIKQHYEAQDYTESLRDAAFLLKDVLQSKSGEYDKDNTKLVDAVLNGSNPILKINNYTTQTEKDFQMGISFGIKAIFMHVRNPISHEKITYEKLDTDSILLYVDYLLRQIDKSNGVSLIEEWLPLVKDETFTGTEDYAKELIKEVPKKKVYELLVAVYNHRCELPTTRPKFFIRELASKLTNEEKNNFVNMLNVDLAKTPGDGSLSMFFNFFAEHFYASLKKVVKLRIEDLVYQGIRNGKYDKEKITGRYAATATWANVFIEKFETKDKCIHAIWDKIFKSDAESDYAYRFFTEHVNLRDATVCNALEPYIKQRLPYNEHAYKFIRRFVWAKNCELYPRFKNEIDAFESEYVKEEDRIPEYDDILY